ncbi:MAG: gliding motility-associated C-terminal domain-containing protein [Flavobacteriales bacterium]|nr:gliding motility-associated C-terminal domain-containing protein [Flavobacteriales bacterium]
MISGGMTGCGHNGVKWFILLLAAFSSPFVDGQAHWLNKFDGTQACHIVDVVTDVAGNAYVTGDLSGTITISSGGTAQGNTTTAGAQDVLVAKFATDGTLLWAKHAGGPAVDVGLKLALGPSGLALTGIFTGTADLFGTVVNAQGGSTDLFVAMLDPADGQAQWVRTAGSPGYTDTPGGITLAGNGQVVVAGKFKGEAVFGSQTLHGAINPATALPSFDVFIAAWAADGTFHWVKQGTGSKDCLAVDIVSAPNDQLYVAGQFNDTLTFDVMHPNTVSNNIFVAKFDPQGNELWFRKCGGGNFNQVSDLHWSAANDLLVTGDQSGTMYWSDGTASTPVPSADPHAYFILRVDASGALLDATSMGSTSVVHVASITEQADSVVVFGEFECDFTGLQDAYGADGLFIATGTPDLFIAKHAAGDLAFVAAQQFRGSALKSAGAISSTPDGLLFAGAFTTELYLPRGSAFWGDPVLACSFLSANAGTTFCDDPDYGSFAWATGTGPATGFLTKGWVEGRKPFDFWDRDGAAPCDRSDRGQDVKILYQGIDAPDTIHECNRAFLSTYVPFQRGGGMQPCATYTPTVGPFGQQLWTNGTNMDTASVFSTGWFTFTVNNTSGCGPWKDSVYVDISAAPGPFVTDSTGTYQSLFISPQYPLILTTCDPQVFWADPVEPGDQVYWVTGTDTIFSDTVHIAASGVYVLYLIGINGCTRSGPVVVQLFEHADINITGVVPELVGSDTIHTCEANCIYGTFTNTWYVDGVPTALPDGLLQSYTGSGGCNQSGVTDTYQPVFWGLQLNGSGWYAIQSEVTIFEECGTELYAFTFMDSVYVDEAEAAVLTFTQSEVYHCAGDTVMIPFTCANCDSIIWTGPGIVWTSPSGDTVLVNMDGLYTAMPLSLSNSLYCAGTLLAVTVTDPPPPAVYMDPSDGVICTGDSVRLYTDAEGSDYLWTGPGTAFLPHDTSIWVHEPGDYYLAVALYSGCTAANGPATVSFFGSPVFSGGASGVLCPGGTVQLQVEAGPGSIVQWQSPLSGTNPVQTVSAPGTYSCTVLSCGSSWNLFYNVVLSVVSADLGVDNFTFCEGQTVTLTAPPGGASYLWLPSGDTLPQLTVSAAGIVELVVIDSAGCSASSGPVQVVEQVFSQLATAAGDSLCAGGAAFLNASGSGELAWYASADTTALLATGTSYTFMPSATDTVFLQQTEDGCSGGFVAVPVIVQDLPPAPLIMGDTAYCTGDALMLVAEAGPGAQLFWSAPWGTYTGDSIGPVAASAMHTGLYACFATLNSCTGDTATTAVVVLDSPGVPEITGDTLLCIGDTLFLQASGSAGSEWQWTMPAGTFNGALLVVPNVGVADTGLYACRAMLGSCPGDTAFNFVRLADCTVVLPPGETPNVITPNGDGVNDAFHFAGEGFARAELHVYNRWGQQVALVLGRNAVWDGHNSFSGEVLSEGVYFYTIEAITDAGENYRKAGYVQVLR